MQFFSIPSCINLFIESKINVHHHHYNFFLIFLHNNYYNLKCCNAYFPPHTSRILTLHAKVKSIFTAADIIISIIIRSFQSLSKIQHTYTSKTEWNRKEDNLTLARAEREQKLSTHSRITKEEMFSLLFRAFLLL